MSSKIVKLESSNVKRLTAVEITPSGSVVVIGGKNGAGKSSVLDSIEYALGGDPSATMPVRRGEEKARIVVDMGDIVVRRTFTAAGGTTLVVTNAEGQKQSSPQAILDKLVGKLTFDPLEFARLSEKKPKEAAEILRGLVGLDFKAKELERQTVFDDRTAVNREVKALEVQINSVPKHENVPTEEVSAEAILAEQKAASEVNSANAALRNRAADLAKALGEAEEAIEDYAGLVTEAEREVARWQKVVTDRKKNLDEAKAKVPEMRTEAKSLVDQAEAATDVDLSGFAQRAAAVEQTNRKVRESKKRADLIAQLKAKMSEADKLTDRLDAIDSEKRKAAVEAKYPVDGLAFDVAGGVTLGGIPFNQCSSADQLRVSVAIGLALNPKLRVLLIRDGSLLDDDSMKVLAGMAEAAGAQIWMERVGTDATTSVVIEDGHVKQPDEEDLKKLTMEGIAEVAENVELPPADGLPTVGKKKAAKSKEGQLL